MHPFTELADRSTGYVLRVLNETCDQVVEELQTSAATHLVKTLQMIQLHKAITAVGLFSMFEARLQSSLGAKDGFQAAGEILARRSDTTLHRRFNHFRLAVNVLKHGRGRSYEALVTEVGKLPFRIKRPGESFFFEGDVSEISTLIEVDDNFVLSCADLVREVTAAIDERRLSPPKLSV